MRSMGRIRIQKSPSSLQYRPLHSAAGPFGGPPRSFQWLSGSAPEEPPSLWRKTKMPNARLYRVVETEKGVVDRSLTRALVVSGVWIRIGFFDKNLTSNPEDKHLTFFLLKPNTEPISPVCSLIVYSVSLRIQIRQSPANRIQIRILVPNQNRNKQTSSQENSVFDFRGAYKVITHIKSEPRLFGHYNPLT